jgi:glycosyltransferase involved in cell wall biosynthesis
MIKISIITAVFNSQPTVCQAIDSVLSQTHPLVESVVIDGASNDGTLDALESYRSRLGVFISEKDNGIYDALNKGINHSSGDVIGFMHADDVFDSHDVLQKVATAFEDPKVDAVYGDLVYVNYSDIQKVVRYWKSGEYNNKSFSKGWMPPHPAFYARRSVYERLGLFDTSYRISADYDITLRFLATGNISATYIPKVFVRMRLGGLSNRSLRTVFNKSIEDYKIIKRNKVGGIFSLICKNFRKLPQFLQH